MPTDVWIRIPRAGKETYDQSLVEYDDDLVAYDGGDGADWVKVDKPTT